LYEIFFGLRQASPEHVNSQVRDQYVAFISIRRGIAHASQHKVDASEAYTIDQSHNLTPAFHPNMTCTPRVLSSLTRTARLGDCVGSYVSSEVLAGRAPVHPEVGSKLPSSGPVSCQTRPQTCQHGVRPGHRLLLEILRQKVAKHPCRKSSIQLSTYNQSQTPWSVTQSRHQDAHKAMACNSHSSLTIGRGFRAVVLLARSARNLACAQAKLNAVPPSTVCCCYYLCRPYLFHTSLSRYSKAGNRPEALTITAAGILFILRREIHQSP
jgi:hypothetical protein